MSQIIDYFLKHPDHLQFLSKEILEKLQELAKMERAKQRSGALPQSAVDAMTSAVDDRLMRDIVNDGRRNREPGWLKPPEAKPVERGSGWSKPAPLEGSVPGIRIMDQMMDVADEIDKRELERKFRRRI